MTSARFYDRFDPASSPSTTVVTQYYAMDPSPSSSTGGYQHFLEGRARRELSVSGTRRGSSQVGRRRLLLQVVEDQPRGSYPVHRVTLLEGLVVGFSGRSVHPLGSLRAVHIGGECTPPTFPVLIGVPSPCHPFPSPSHNSGP